MKKIIAVIVALLLVLTLAGCSKDEPSTEDGSSAVDTYEVDSEETESTESTDSEEDSGVLSPEFKKTMDDYEAWFDHYCEVMQKYEENPSDLELLSETTELLSEETVMLEEMENMDQSEMNAAELAYYLEVTARIEKKLLEVAY
ncbi:MAG: lipoprotein [Mogibacterium sp.]|nr:lipoprotein [Mogibacterium sp.]